MLEPDLAAAISRLYGGLGAEPKYQRLRDYFRGLVDGRPAVPKNPLQGNNHPDIARYYFPGLCAKPWHDPKALGLEGYLEERAPALITEFEGMGHHDMFRAYREPWGDLHDSGSWRVLPLWLTERPQPALDALPVLSQTLAGFPGLERSFTVLSRLSPGTHIPAHRGIFNFRLRAHLGLAIPTGCRMRVGEETRYWAQGRVLVFDDSFDHEVWHQGQEDRIILCADIWHPDLEPAEVEVLRPFVAAINQTRLGRQWNATLLGAPAS